MPRAPWPMAGRLTSGSMYSVTCPASPSRFTPAAARMMASNWPSRSFRSRVSTFPRSCAILRSGRMLISCAWRLRLLVPTVAPLGRSRNETLLRDSSASRGSSRFVMAPRCSPSGKTVGTSFMLCTAMSISSRSMASSISFTKSPLPPTIARGTSRILSPVVLILVSVTVMPGYFFSSSDFTHSACQRASALARVPIRICFRNECSLLR